MLILIIPLRPVGVQLHFHDLKEVFRASLLPGEGDSLIQVKVQGGREQGWLSD